MSVYALIWIVLAVAIIEIIEWKRRNISVKNILIRYYKLVITMIVPPCCTFIYFKFNNSLESAINQFYRFNREVYPKYVAGLGENVLQLLLMVSVIGCTIFSYMKGEKWESIILLLVMIFLAPRGYGFHGLA